MLKEIIHELDLVLIMSVNPGFGGQKFIEQTYRKVEALKNLIIKHNTSTLIEIDGGVDFNNAKKLVELRIHIAWLRKQFDAFERLTNALLDPTQGAFHQIQPNILQHLSILINHYKLLLLRQLFYFFSFFHNILYIF